MLMTRNNEEVDSKVAASTVTGSVAGDCVKQYLVTMGSKISDKASVQSFKECWRAYVRR